jgi:2-dehydro-3-deoxygluconokinase
MTEPKPRVVCVGEVMIEFVRGGDGRFGIASAGDTFNVAVYLARAGADAALATAVGDDPYSDAIVALATAEGVNTDLMLRLRGRLPALAVIDTDPAGHRRAHAWREGAPARELFELADWSRVADGLLKAKMIYFSGITLSLYSNNGLGRFLAVLEMARQQGVKVAFDGNFRPRGWGGDLSRTRAVFLEALKRVDIALPTYDDEAVLWGDPSPEATVERFQAFGINEIVVKNGPNSALVAAGAASEFVPVPEVIVPVDTTAAGDSFNAAYLAARVTGKGPREAAAAAHRLAGQVIRHRGALMPRAAAAVH